MPLVKPAPWGVSQAFVAPEYQGLWRGLVAVYDVGPQALPFDLGPNKRHATGFDNSFPEGTKVLTPVGVGREWLSGTGQGIILPDVALTDQVTVMAVISTTTAEASMGFRHVFSRFPGWTIAHDDNRDSLRFLLGSGGTTFALIADHADYADGEPHVVGGSYDGSTIRGYFDGMLNDTGSDSGNIDMTGQTRIAGYWDNDGFEWRGRIMLTAYWSRVLTPTEVARFSADPFGLVRPNWDYVTAGFSTTSLYATGDGTIVDVVNENDQGGA